MTSGEPSNEVNGRFSSVELFSSCILRPIEWYEHLVETVQFQIGVGWLQAYFKFDSCGVWTPSHLLLPVWPASVYKSVLSLRAV
ncbi:hypothetical protein RSAG8_06007, partial [Rhizoctonia solani AG-8 WAC10335]